ncbi:MAG: hypothetical protein ABI134_10235, partial [Byssovorax sp.]
MGGIERGALERPWGSVGALVYADARRLGVPGSAAYTTEAARLTTSRVVVGFDASALAGELRARRARGRDDRRSHLAPRADRVSWQP